jgi:hypothetical protein
MASKNKRQPIQVNEDQREYKRIKYSLKMALRMVNGHFTQFNILQYNTNLVDRNNNYDKVEVDSWFVPNPSQRDELLKSQKFT